MYLNTKLEDFKGNIEITLGDYMYLFYAKQIKNSENILLEKPISIYDMNIESPTPGTANFISLNISCLLYTSPSPRDRTRSRMPSSA